MEWVETRAKSVDEAKERALDELGIAADEAEFEVMSEPKPGLFGWARGEARVRARVAPRTPPPKQDARRRKRSGDQPGSTGATDDGPDQPGSGDGSGSTSSPTAGADINQEPDPGSGGPRAAAARTSPAPTERRDGAASPSPTKEQDMDEVVSVERQADVVETFLDGLLDAFGAEGRISRTAVAEDTIELAVAADDDSGLLIGPKGQTLQAIQELGRTVVQRAEPGRHQGRVRIDVGGYRARRAEALARFTRQVADQVLEDGGPKALEPMGPADRKVVHDTVNEIAGVATRSEGEDPERRVVIVAEQD